MDSRRFDALTRVFAGAGSRRVVLGRVVAGLAALTAGAGLTEGQAACASVGKRCGKVGKGDRRKRIRCCDGLICRRKSCVCQPGSAAAGCADACRFVRTATRWTLEADCTIRRTLEIPDGVTLDGNGKTVTMTGALARFVRKPANGRRIAPGIFAGDGAAAIVDLTVTSQGLRRGDAPTGARPVGIAWQETAGAIERVTVRDLTIDSGQDPTGIDIVGSQGQQVTIDRTTVTGAIRTGIALQGVPETQGVAVTIVATTVAVRSSFVSVAWAGTGSLSIRDTTITDTGIGYGIDVGHYGGPFTGSIDNTSVDIETNEPGAFGITAATLIGNHPCTVSIDNDTRVRMRVSGDNRATGIFLARFTGTSFEASVRATTVDVEAGSPTGIEIFGNPGEGTPLDAEVAEVNVTARSTSSASGDGIGILAQGDGKHSIARSVVTAAGVGAIGIYLIDSTDSGIEATAEDNTITVEGANSIGISATALAGSSATTALSVTGNAITMGDATGTGIDAFAGSDVNASSTVRIERNTIAAPTASAEGKLGVQADAFGAAAAITISDNTISGMRDTNADPAVRSCGVAVGPPPSTPGTVTVAANTFANNDEDICDPYTPIASGARDAATARERAAAGRRRQPDRQPTRRQPRQVR